MNYNNRKFRSVSNTDNGDVSNDMVFHYHQMGNVLTCNYKGIEIVSGQLLGLVDEEGNIDMRYQHINLQGVLMTGICNSRPEMLENGKVRLLESWQWTSGDGSKGQSVLEEV